MTLACKLHRVLSGAMMSTSLPPANNADALKPDRRALMSALAAMGVFLSAISAGEMRASPLTLIYVTGLPPNPTGIFNGGLAPSVVLNRPWLVGPAVTDSSWTVNEANGINGEVVSISASGHVSVSPSGTQSIGARGVLPLSVTLDRSTAGIKQGTVTINNLGTDTSVPGASGLDPDDGIGISATVYDPANASFSGMSDQNVLNIDFGAHLPGGLPFQIGFSIWNLSGTPGFTAHLDGVSLMASGDTGVLRTTLPVLPSDLAPDTEQLFSAIFNLSTPGDYSATWRPQFRSRFPTGTQAGDLETLTINLTGTVLPAATSVPTPSTLALILLPLMVMRLVKGWGPSADS